MRLISIRNIKVNKWVAAGVITVQLGFVAWLFWDTVGSSKPCDNWVLGESYSPDGKLRASLIGKRCWKVPTLATELRIEPINQTKTAISDWPVPVDTLSFIYNDKGTSYQTPPAIGLQWKTATALRVLIYDDTEIQHPIEAAGHLQIELIRRSDWYDTNKSKVEQNELLSKRLSRSIDAPTLEASFAHLSKLVLEKTPVGDIEIWYDPKRSRLIKQLVQDFYKPVIETQLNSSDDWFVISYSLGMSMDPHFVVHRKTPDGLKEVGGVGATRLYVPGNGSIYASGHTNTMFNVRQKIALENGKLVPVTQPFAYVGLETRTKAFVTLTASPESQQAVAVLPKGSPITVLINDRDNYLVKTPFGILGWIRIPNGYRSPIEGIYFAGD